MPSPKADLRVQVTDDEIIVTRPGSIYAVTYYKPENSPQLLAKRIADRNDARAPMGGLNLPRLESCQCKGARAWVDCVGGGLAPAPFSFADCSCRLDGDNVR